MLEKGESESAVEQRLVGLGMDAEGAKRIVAEQRRADAEVEKSDGQTEMRFGVVAFLGAVVLLFVSGPSSFLTWVCLISGALSIWRGLSKQRAARVATR
jgi:hypothetical protein